MRSKLYFAAVLLSFCVSVASRAQNVGIGTTTPDASALLDLTSTTLGFLMPRVTNAQMLAISSPATGLIVWNSTNNIYYYNAGTPAVPNWVALLSGSSAWNLTGNAGTTAGTNFLGTTDAKDLVFKTNSTERMRMLSTGNIGIGTTTPGGYLDIAPSIPSVAATSTYNFRSDGTLSGAIAAAQTAHYNTYNLPTINLSGGASNTLTSLYNSYEGLTATAGTITNYFGDYIAAPTGAATITNKYALVTESGAGNVGFGTTAPNASAILDLTSTTTGFLMPRVTNAQMLAISSPATGLIVWNSTNNIYYYNAGTPAVPNWVALLSGATAWALTGNAGTTAGTNFLGTTDAKDLVFKTNSTERMRMLSTGNIGVGTTTPAGYLDVAPSVPAVAATTTYNLRSDATLSGTLAAAQTAHYNNYNLPTINLTGGASNTVTSLYNNYEGLTATAGTVTNYYGEYIAAPTGAGTITNKYALVTESGAGNVGINTTTPAHPLHSINSGTTDEVAGVYGVASGSTTNQAIGVWGDATNTTSTNTGTIGVLATGNGNTTAGQTNTALEVADGDITVGRTTQSSTGATVVEGATAGSTYTAQGPSGVIEIAGPTADKNLNGFVSWYQFANSLTINNRYATTNSIILLQVVQMIDGTTNQSAGTFNGSGVTFLTSVDNRTNGSFDISISAVNMSGTNITLDGGTVSSDQDKIRVGYVIINPSK